MKTFMEEYGLIVVAAIIIMIFVLVASPIGNAFYNCTNLTSLEIPNSVMSIGFAAIDGTNLTSINYFGTMEERNSIERKPNLSGQTYLSELTITVHCTDGNIVIPAYE